MGTLGTQFITILHGFSPHQEVFLRLTWGDYQWDSREFHYQRYS